MEILKKGLAELNTNDLILRTDNGVQFRSREFQSRIRDLDISHERPMVNTPEENAQIESFHGTLKRGYNQIYKLDLESKFC